VVWGTLTGMNYFVLNNSIYLLRFVGSVAAYLIVSITKSNLLVYVFILQSVEIVILILQTYFAHKKIPFKLKFVVPSGKVLKNYLGFNIYLISSKVSNLLLYTADKQIIQKMMGATMVTEYHISSRINDIMNRIITLPMSSLMPNISAAFATGDKAFIRKINIEGTFLYTFLVVPIFIAVYLNLDSFIYNWIGPGYEESVLGAKIFIISVAVSANFKVFDHSLLAKGEVKEMGIINFAYAVVNVFISILLIKVMDSFIGAIVSTMIFWLIVYPIMITWISNRRKLFPTGQVLYSTYPSVIVTLVGFGVSMFLNIPKQGTWLTFLFYLGISYLATIILHYFLVPKTIKKKALEMITRKIKRKK
jgi:O-antigen/teichoic acid export membrane protein